LELLPEEYPMAAPKGQEHDCRWSSKRWNKEVGSWNLASFITTMLVLLGSKFVKFV